MSILGYVYLADVAGTNTQLGQTTNPPMLKEPPVSLLMSSVREPDDIVEDWYKRLSFNDYDNYPLVTMDKEGDYISMIVEYPSNSTELWVKFMDSDLNSIASSTYWGTNRNSETIMFDFFNIRNGVKTLVGRIVASAPNKGTPSLYYRLYGANGSTVIKQHVIGIATSFKTNMTNGDFIADFRFSFDKVAGFIQVYDYTATRITEVLGQTIEDLPVTHVVLYSHPMLPKGTFGVPFFRIVANEPTFAMFVMPFYAKEEGTDQNQISGNYSRFSMGRYNYSNDVGVVLEKTEVGNPVMYSYTPKTLVEQGLPNNYKVLSVQINAVVDGVATTANPIDFSTYLKQKSTGTRFELPQQPVKNNIDYAATKQPQVRTARWDKNPVTGRNWQPGDFSDFEIGFKI